MRLFLDTANIDEIRDAARMGVLAGVTTNPTLMARESGISYRDRVVQQSVEIFDRFHQPTQVMAASIRTPPHVIQASLAGSHVATIPYAVLQAMLKHPLTDTGIERFIADSTKYASV